jgi:DNA helicase II / ATP-dependent DNA helicase PcrA
MLPGQSVLFLSFSRAAVARLIQASANAIPHDQRSRLVVQTFHGFFWSVLRSHGYLIGSPNRLEILMPHDERALSQGMKSDSPDWPAWLVKREQLFFSEGKTAFDLFAPMTLRLIRSSSWMRQLITQQYPLIIVDEAQDTGPDAWAIIEVLKDSSQVICLGDLDQQIFDHLPGIGPERVVAIRNALSPHELDLGQQNNRSPGTDIAVFANDILRNTPRGSAYAGVSRFGYNPNTHDLNTTLRRSLAIIFRKGRAAELKFESCAILAGSGREVAEITAALSNGARPVAHRVAFDEAETLLASRVAAFLLEPTDLTNVVSHVVTALGLLSDFERARGTKGGLSRAASYLRWAGDYAEGKAMPKVCLGAALKTALDELRAKGFVGDPRVDWLRVKDVLRDSADVRLRGLAGYLDYLVAFGRGQFLSAGLHNCWVSTGTYFGARSAFDVALAQDSILETSEELRGIHVMTIHRSKAKQFDAVVLFRKGIPGVKWRSSFVWRDDTSPYTRSRKILRVGITRARKEVLILDPAFPACPLLKGHNL